MVDITAPTTPPARWREEDVPIGPLRLRLRRLDGGGGSERDVLLLHGLGVSGSVWQAFGRRLARGGLRPLAPDLRGHGASDHPADGYQPSDYARDLAALVEAVARPPLVVVGHSLGALVGLTLAAERPDLVAALALLDPPLDPTRRHADIAAVARLRHEPAGALEAYLLRGDPAGGEAQARGLAALFRQAADGPFEAVLSAPLGHPDVRALAPRLACPTLLVQADPRRGGVLGDEAAGSLVEALPRGRLLRIEGAGHAVHATHPAPLVEAVLDLVGAGRSVGAA